MFTIFKATRNKLSDFAYLTAPADFDEIGFGLPVWISDKIFNDWVISKNHFILEVKNE